MKYIAPSRYSKLFIGFFVGIALLVGVAPAQAASLTGAQIQAVVQLLQSFTVDSATINNVAATLGGSAVIVPPPATICPALSYNLYLGLSDANTAGQVSQLQRFLNVNPTGYFGLQTRAAVIKLQSQNGVYPVTGGVGPLTRALIQRLCGGQVVSAPTIQSITPTQGPVGTQVTISGWGFTSDNTIRFGIGGAMHVAAANNGTTLNFIIPTRVGPCSYAGDTSPIRCFVADTLVVPNIYTLSVSNANGQSNTLQFTVTGAQSVGGLSVTQPAANQVYTRGQDMPISWSYPVTPGSANIVLDLYTAQGNKVGTIAVTSNTTGSYTWHIPGFPQNYMCTMQYPNGLCGVSIPTGQYYIEATATSDGFNPIGATIYATGQSGVFTINQQ